MCAHRIWLGRVGLSLAWWAGRGAVRRAVEAEQAVNELQQQMRQQEQELDHLRRCGA